MIYSAEISLYRHATLPHSEQVFGIVMQPSGQSQDSSAGHDTHVGSKVGDKVGLFVVDVEVGSNVGGGVGSFVVVGFDVGVKVGLFVVARSVVVVVVVVGSNVGGGV